ncbi:unnamed protein product [Didymodactylos carnosus]|uniref:Uncharacterized protein n=1 Tax=Didymodactylos carnosus TaxID=1234261 RepID=A0A815LSE7_9BILA|nr:unnamed protein product [Didymodactylos carnosus]CAF4300946.1 unnamed protein product [Didymodactylos carnosus]
MALIKQYPIKRVQLATDRSNIHLREERFSLPVILATSANASTTTAASTNEKEKRLYYLRLDGNLSRAYESSEVQSTDKTVADVVEEAANEIVVEGAKLSKEKEAQWLAKQLREAKHFGESKKADLFDENISRQIGETCIYLYTIESFWYSILNSALRNYETITLEQITTLGPFSWLLDRYLYEKSNVDNRGTHARCGVDVSSLSGLTDEEEYIMYPGSKFNFVRYEYDKDTKKHFIYLKATEWQR